ncbi:MAG: glycosyltransferase family 32 protein [Marvinbryantia sp.]|jgi:mannosyltransferase OCH1-like enzyme|uniref:glycosyltransferase family 32 protein n=1 Tax=Marvinbryantia sp. TaxID=2496532 RepID=UPI00399C168F
MIPKKIHYCWFGKNPKPDIVTKCLKSWKKYMPEYEIIEWNEDNYDINKCAYIKEAYKAGKWAFVSDYVRFDVLNSMGGIYFDTDVELLRRIPEDVLNNTAFTGMESAGKVSPGLVFASIPHHPFLEEILKVYEQSEFVQSGKRKYKTVNEVTTEILEKKGFIQNQKYQKIYDIAIYPSDFFCGYNQDLQEFDIKPSTISVHHYAGTWKKKTIKDIIQKQIKKIFGKKIYMQLLKIKRKIFGIHEG